MREREKKEKVYFFVILSLNVISNITKNWLSRKLKWTNKVN